MEIKEGADLADHDWLAVVHHGICLKRVGVNEVYEEGTVRAAWRRRFEKGRVWDRVNCDLGLK
jgi:hypothetical protein